MDTTASNSHVPQVGGGEASQRLYCRFSAFHAKAITRCAEVSRPWWDPVLRDSQTKMRSKKSLDRVTISQ